MNHSEAQAAREAIERGHVDQALHHINNLTMIGGHDAEVQELQQRLWHYNNSVRKRNLNLQGYAVGCAVLGYALLSIESPAAWGLPIWGLVSMVAIPAMVGIFAGGSVTDGQKSARFWRGFTITAIAIAVHSMVGMLIARSKMDSADKSYDIAVFLLVMIVHGVVAGIVAGFTGTLIGPKAGAN